MIFNKEFELMPEKKLKELQLERIKWTVNHAYNNSEYYRKKYDAAGFSSGFRSNRSDMRASLSR